MSRSNHYRLCGCKSKENPTCWYHVKYGWEHGFIHSYDSFKPTRKIEGRRFWERKQRYPKDSPKIWHNPPPKWWWQEQHAKYRRICSQLILKSEDPVLPREQDIIDLWGWY